MANCDTCSGQGALFSNVGDEQVAEDCPVCHGYSAYWGSPEMQLELALLESERQAFDFFSNPFKYVANYALQSAICLAVMLAPFYFAGVLCDWADALMGVHP